jgi:hypothetical protein
VGAKWSFNKRANMLKTHFDAIEEYLIALSRIQENTGHSLHKGTPREIFVREFLTGHLSEQITVGTGEIIDADSKPRESRNQFDNVIYRRDYPKIDFGGGINGFLVESVIATIEVKSTLRKEDFEHSIKAASNLKRLKKHLYLSSSTIRHQENVLSYVVAYNGPSKMATVYNWINSTYSSLNISYPSADKGQAKSSPIPSLSLDGIFVLGKGFILFRNTPISFLSKDTYDQKPEVKWEVVNTAEGNLFVLFLVLMLASTNVLNPMAYARNLSIPDENVVPKI